MAGGGEKPHAKVETYLAQGRRRDEELRMNSGTELREQRKQQKHGSEQWRLK